MSQEQPDNSGKPVSGFGLFLRTVFAAIVIGGIGVVIWYLNR